MTVFGGGAFGKWLGHESGVLVNGISALMKKTWELCHLSAMWGHKKKTVVYKPGRGSSPDSKSASALILEFSASKTIKKISVGGKPSSLGIIIAA